MYSVSDSLNSHAATRPSYPPGEKTKLDAVKEALRRMRQHRENFALHHGNTALESPGEASSLVKMLATSVVEFVTAGMTVSGPSGSHDDVTSLNATQITTEPSVVSGAMEHQQQRAEVHK